MDSLLDPDFLKPACGFAAIAYGVAAVALLIVALSAKDQPLRNDARIVAPLVAIVAIGLALIDVGLPRATQSVLPILYLSVVLALAFSGVALVVLAILALKHRATRIAALLAAPLPLAAAVVLVLIGFMLANSRFCC